MKMHVYYFQTSFTPIEIYLINCELKIYFFLFVLLSMVIENLYIKNTIVVCLCVCPELIGKTTNLRKLKICIQG